MEGPDSVGARFEDGSAGEGSTRIVRPTVVSLFCGCGGSSLGYRMAGFDERLAVDFDRNSCDVFRCNFPDVPVACADIRGVSTKEVLAVARLSCGELDVLDGSPPCQGFSMSGKRVLADSRNALWQEFARVLNEARPKAFVVENVPGLIYGAMRSVYARMMSRFRSHGYQVAGAILCAADYGVPQLRNRLIVIGIREDLRICPPGHPAPTVIRRMTFGEATSGIDCHGPRVSPCLEKVSAMILPGDSGLERLGPAKPFFSLSRPNPSKPAPTVTKTRNMLAPSGPFWLSIAAVKRLCSFPDEFALAGSHAMQWARLGNSVPPLLMAAIATHVKRTLDNSPKL